MLLSEELMFSLVERGTRDEFRELEHMMSLHQALSKSFNQVKGQLDQTAENRVRTLLSSLDQFIQSIASEFKKKPDALVKEVPKLPMRPGTAGIKTYVAALLNALSIYKRSGSSGVERVAHHAEKALR